MTSYFTTCRLLELLKILAALLAQSTDALLHNMPPTSATEKFKQGQNAHVTHAGNLSAATATDAKVSDKRPATFAFAFLQA